LPRHRRRSGKKKGRLEKSTVKGKKGCLHTLSKGGEKTGVDNSLRDLRRWGILFASAGGKSRKGGKEEGEKEERESDGGSLSGGTSEKQWAFSISAKDLYSV